MVSGMTRVGDLTQAGQRAPVVVAHWLGQLDWRPFEGRERLARLDSGSMCVTGFVTPGLANNGHVIVRHEDAVGW